MKHILELTKMKNRIDEAFKRVNDIDSDNIELQSHLAKYLCILVSGYVETAVSITVQEYARRNGSSTLCRFVESHISRFTNPSPEKIKNLLGRFAKEWRRQFEASVSKDKTEALTTLVKNRNKIAHGLDSQLTFSGVQNYYKIAQDVVKSVQVICLENTKNVIEPI